MRIEQIVAEVLETDPEEIGDDTGYAVHERWTSLAHLEIMTVTEETYGISLTSTEMRSTTSVGALRTLLKSKGVEA